MKRKRREGLGNSAEEAGDYIGPGHPWEEANPGRSQRARREKRQRLWTKTVSEPTSELHRITPSVMQKPGQTASGTGCENLSASPARALRPK